MRLSMRNRSELVSVLVVSPVLAAVAAGGAYALFAGGFTGVSGVITAAIVLITVALLLLNAAILREAASLDGTVVTVRRMFGSVRVDLARSAVSLDERVFHTAGHDTIPARAYMIPYLRATAPGERPVELRLGTSGGLLPPEELLAVADAVDSLLRQGEEAEAAAEVAARLRAWAMERDE